MQTLNFDISGMTCGGCTSSVQHALSKLDGVSHAEVTLHPGTATLVVDPARASPTQIQAVITTLAIPPRHGQQHRTGRQHHEQEKSQTP